MLRSDRGLAVCSLHAEGRVPDVFALADARTSLLKPGDVLLQRLQHSLLINTSTLPFRSRSAVFLGNSVK